MCLTRSYRYHNEYNDNGIIKVFFISLNVFKFMYLPKNEKFTTSTEVHDTVYHQ